MLRVYQILFLKRVFISLYYRPPVNINAQSRILNKDFHLPNFCINWVKFDKTWQRNLGTDKSGGKNDYHDEYDSRIIKCIVNSLRADMLLKVGLGLPRTKIERSFYENKIRINGKNMIKKSYQLKEGDELDMVRNFSQTNSSHIVVARVILLSAEENEEGYCVNLRRYKSILINNYSGTNAYKPATTLIN